MGGCIADRTSTSAATNSWRDRLTGSDKTLGDAGRIGSFLGFVRGSQDYNSPFPNSLPLQIWQLKRFPAWRQTGYLVIFPYALSAVHEPQSTVSPVVFVFP